MLSLILLFIAPIVQIIFSVLRIYGYTTTPINAIAAISLLSGLILSYILMSLAIYLLLAGVTGVKGGTAEVSIVFLGIFITCISIPIRILSYFIHSNNKNKSAL